MQSVLDDTVDERLVATPVVDSERAPERRPSLVAVHGALILCQCMFGVGSVVGKLGVASFNPMVFALIREVAAGVLLLLWALYQDGIVRPRSKDALIFLGCGFFIFVNQAAFIVGDKLAGAVLGSAWQPTQPVFTLLISISLGWERCTLGKTVGVLASFGGAAFMVMYGQSLTGSSGSAQVTGNLLFTANCLGTSLYVITVKLALGRGYPASTVTAWSYLCGACMMACVATGFSSNCTLVHFVCPAQPDAAGEGFVCDEYETSCAPWAVPPSAVLPLCYWILFNSCAAYWLMTWANKHARAGFVLAYCALQPLVAMLLSVVIVELTGGDSYKGLKLPGLNALGSIGVLLGLGVIMYEGKAQHEADARQQGLHAQQSSQPSGLVVNPHTGKLH